MRLRAKDRGGRWLGALLCWAVLLGAGCSGLLGAPPQPLTTARLRQIALAQGIGLGQKGIQLNRAIGRAFQDFSIASMELVENHQPFPSLLRRRNTARLRQPRPTVVPDAVTEVSEIIVREDGTKVVRSYPRCAFVEVKAVRGTLVLSTSNHQIRGLVDAVATPGCLGTQANPVLIFITTADTSVSADVLALATSRRVSVWQTVAYEKPLQGEGPPQLTLGPARLLNPLAQTLPPTAPETFSAPRSLRMGLAPSSNPDPTELVP